MKKNKTNRNPGRSLLRAFTGLLFLVTVGGGLWALFGLPGSWVTRWINPSLPDGFVMRASEVRYRPGEGFRFSELELYSARDRVTPLIEAAVLTVNPALLRRIRHKEWQVELDFLDGKVETNLGVWADDLQTDQLLRVHDIDGGITLTDTRCRFRDLEGSLPNMDLVLGGEILLRKGGTSKGELSLARTSRIVARVLVFIENFTFENVPEIAVEFSPSVEGGGTPKIELSLNHTGPAKHRGFLFEEVRAQAVYENKVFRIPEFLIRENTERSLGGRATVDFNRNLFEVELENTLRRFGLEAVSPFDLGNLLGWLQLRVEDRCDFNLKLGPNSFSKPGQIVSGSFQVENAFYRDAFFPELRLDLDLNIPSLKLHNVEGKIGHGKGGGPIAGTVEMDFQNGYRMVEVTGAFYPDVAVSMVGALAEKYIREWEFRESPPSFTAMFHLEKTGAPLLFSVSAEGKHALWRGTAFDQISAQVDYTDEKLSIREVAARRNLERLNGELLFTRGFKGCELKVNSSFHLPDVLRLIGPEPARLVRNFRFRGPTLVKMEGFLDFTEEAAHRLQADVALDDLVWQWIHINHLTGSLTLDKQILEVPNLHAVLEGGAMQASFSSTDTFRDHARFDLEVELADMDLQKVITKATDLEETPYSGELSLDLTISGLLKNTGEMARADSFRGKGRVEIKEGSLFRIPLLLGLSQILSKIVKGFGYASQSDFTADFEIDKGRIRSNELFLQGNVLSIAGPGSYRFADRNISADLKIHLLKEGVLSDALKLILWPIRKLVEVQLTGTLDDPDWQPKNLPKEIFGK